MTTATRPHPEQVALAAFTREPWALNAARASLLEELRQTRHRDDEQRARKALKLVELEIAAVDVLTRLAAARKDASTVDKEPW
jgi:hypothetical protein